ncbi:MAG: PTS sugar transporter subunit IIA [Candidatus Marinimicrobia bacterium]|nr:PTS sugar transporter subunit IIA [Candidatus Neomarinimicrobiota bacterium]
MELYKILKKQSCMLDLAAKSKEDCLRQIARSMTNSVKEIEEQKIYEALMAREISGSTGFENGVAIPHAKIAGLKDFAVALMISKKGVDFHSVDKKKSNLFFVIIGPDDNPRDHLQILAQISRFTRNHNALKELLAVKTAEALIESFYRYTSDSLQFKKTKEKKKLFLMVLNELRFFDDILEIFMGKGISGINILESSGARNQLSDIPLFADFLNFLGERSDNRKTIMALLSESEVKEITVAIEEVMGDLNKHSGALIMELDVHFYKGTLES